ncbi:MAG: hypothetical protein ACLGIR_14380 [Actinomycetes bacterium]
MTRLGRSLPGHPATTERPHRVFVGHEGMDGPAHAPVRALGTSHPPRTHQDSSLWL